MKHPIPYPLVLTTERLLLCSPEQAHAAALREAIADSIEALRLWMPWAQSVPTLAEAEASCLKAAAAFEEGTDHRLHLFLKEPLTLIGSSGMHEIDWSVPKVELGYWIRTPYQGNGYVTEAVGEITRYALEDLGMNRVEIRMGSTNMKSRAVPERLGFTFEGTLRNDDRHMDGTLRHTCIYARIGEGE